MSARILIVDDHVMVRQALRHFLESEERESLSADESAGEHAFSQIARYQPDLVLLDLSLKTCDGLALTRSIRDQYPALPILILSLHSEDLFAERALRAGASGYIMKSESPDSLIEAIRVILDGGLYFSQRMRQQILSRMRGSAKSHELSALSDRELEVFQLIGQGYSTQQAANMLEVSIKTIESHRAHIKKKLAVTDNTALADRASLWVAQDRH